MKKIILIGFMGSGKSSVGKTLAKNLGIDCIEMDSKTLESSGKESIKEIFEQDGEIHFRELELEVAKNLRDEKDCVIASGGGVVMNELTIHYLKESGVTVYLKASFDQTEKRIGDSTKRPLFKNAKSAEELFSLRLPLYEKYADVTVETDGKTVSQVTDEIIKILKPTVLV